MIDRRRLRALLRKELAEAARNRAVVWTFVLLAALFTMLPLLLAFGLAEGLQGQLAADPHSEELLALVARQHPEVASLPELPRLQAFLLRQVMPLFLVLPLFGAMSVATYSVVGEKMARSLEPLLATPLTTAELLLAKTLAAALPTVAGTWLSFALFAAGVRLLGGEVLLRVAVDGAAWATILLIGPLVALLGIGAGVVVSARAKDPRGAQQIGGILVLPLVALGVAQAAGVFLLGPAFVLVGAVVLAVVDAALLAWGSRRFDRERVFVGWR